MPAIFTAATMTVPPFEYSVYSWPLRVLFLPESVIPSAPVHCCVTSARFSGVTAPSASPWKTRSFGLRALGLCHVCGCACTTSDAAWLPGHVHPCPFLPSAAHDVEQPYAPPSNIDPP